MRSSTSSATRELVRLYSLARPGEYNLARFLVDHPELGDELALERLPHEGADDAQLALGLAPVIGKFKALALRRKTLEQRDRTDVAVRRILGTARRGELRVELEAGDLLGDLLADPSHEYIAFVLEGARVAVLRRHLLRARGPLRNFLDLAAYVDPEGLHLRWRAGRGGVNLRPQPEAPKTTALVLDLRSTQQARVSRREPIPIAEVLAGLGLL